MALVDNNVQPDPNWTKCSVDIISIVAGAEEVVFKCSKEDLIEKSPYFQAMFSNSMRESSQSEVRLPFVDPEIFSLFINYFAVGYLPLTVSSLIDVYLQADQWLMPEVKNQCKTCLKSSIDVDSCFLLLQATNSPVLSELSTICEDWIIENHHEAFAHKLFGTISKELLANLLRRRCTLTEVDKLNAVLSWWHKQINTEEAAIVEDYARIDNQSRKRKRISCEVSSSMNEQDKENRSNNVSSPIERSYSSPKFTINRSERLGPSPKKKQKTDRDQSERNDELRPLLSLINFSKMTVDQLLTVVEPSKVLSTTDLMHYLKIANDREHVMKSRVKPQSVVVSIELPRQTPRSTLTLVKSGPFTLYGHQWEVMVRNSITNSAATDEGTDREARESDVCLVCLSELSDEGFYFKGGEMLVLNTRKTKSKSTGAFEGAVFTKGTPVWFRTIDRPLNELLRPEAGFVYGTDPVDPLKGRLEVKINFPLRHAIV
jgi:hypothetical protein